MALFSMRDSWEVWRRKVNAAIGNVEEIDADEIVYDNTTSGLTATNAQSAIDEIASDVSTLNEFKTDMPSGYVYIGRENFSDTIENGTYSTCLDTLAAHLLTVTQALEDDELIMVDEVVLVGNASMLVRANAFTNQDTVTNLVCSVVSSSSAMFIMWNGILYSGSGTSTLQHLQYTVSSGNWTFSDDSSASSGASRTVTCHYKKFKKVK